MELITAQELANRAGLSISAIVSNTKKGLIPTVEDDIGRKRFEPSSALRAIEQHAIKPRGKRSEDPDAENETEESEGEVFTERETPEASSDEAEAQAVPPEGAQLVVKLAIGRARRAFKKRLKAAIEAQEGGEENELTLLRMHLKADEIFEYMRQEILG